MGLYGAIIVLPSPQVQNCPANANNLAAEHANNENDFRLATSAYDQPDSCYDREYLFQFSEMDPLHPQPGRRSGGQSLRQLRRLHAGRDRAVPPRVLHDQRPLDARRHGQQLRAQYPHQPYNGNPHMHPGELVLLRIIGTGRWQHPFHEHGNHVRVLARDGNLLVSQTDPTKLAGPLLFTTTTTPGPHHGRHLLLDRPGPELGRLRPRVCGRQQQVHAGQQRLLHRGPDARPTTTSGAPITTRRSRHIRSALSPAAGR